MTEAWHLDPRGRADLFPLGDDVLCHRASTGRYADLPGEDETAILALLKTTPWRDGLRRRLADKPWLRDIITDPRRAAAVVRVPLPRAARVLDVGSGWGQLAIPLAKLGHLVCALDQTPSRLRLLGAIAKQEDVRLERVCGDIETFPLRPHGFDLVVLNGVLEWTVRDRDADHDAASHQAAVLARCRSLLAPGGKIFLAIENALGLKYLMGSRDDHAGVPWVGIADDSEAELLWRAAGAERMRARTHDLAGYQRLFAAAEVRAGSTWGCFPDYKLPDHVVRLDEVDAFLLGEAAWTEHHGDNGTPLPAEWPLRTAYRRFARLGVGHAIAPSYAFVLEAVGATPPATARSLA